MNFTELALSEELLNALSDMGFAEASPIQSQAIPLLLSGSDLIGQAQTGTGKTAAFGIPAIEKVTPFAKNVQCMVLCPTRELANQVCEEFKKLSKYKKGIRPVAIYGGENIERQIKALQMGANIVIGTPGRVIDHLNRRTLDLSQLQTLILDEADEMLNMGFFDDIENILSLTPASRQTVFFSATMSREIMDLTKRFQNNPEIVKVTRNEVTSANIKQLHYEVRREAKTELMCRLIENYSLKSMLVFANTKKKVDELCEELQAKGFVAEGLHGDMRQQARNTVMARFRSGSVNILIATDVAARGIDVENVEAVFNYDIPQDLEYYVHRIGRTGRAGKSGLAFTFVTNRDRGALREIENYTKVRIEKAMPPSSTEIVAARKERFMSQLQEAIAAEGQEEFTNWVSELNAEGLSSDAIVAALLRLNHKDVNKQIAEYDFAGRSAAPRGERTFESRDRNDRGDSRRDGRSSDRREMSRDRDSRSSSDRNDRSSSDRNSRTSEARPRRSAEGGSAPRSNENMVRLFLSVGRKDNVRPGDIVGAIAGESGIGGDKIGAIDIYDKFSFVNIPSEHVNSVLSVMTDNTIRGQKVSMEVAK